jgi:hypothetical protein
MRGVDGLLPAVRTWGTWGLFLHCFLDDSGKESEPTMPYVVLAGYFAEMNIWIALWEKWAELLLKHEISGIHMRELIPMKGEYKDKGWDATKRDEVIGDFITEISKANLIGVGVAVEVTAWCTMKKLNPDVPFGSIQEFCLGRIMRRIVDRLSAAQRSGKVALVFDRDPEFSSKRIRLFNHYLQSNEQARRYLASIMFADPNIYPGLQCADLLAWETRKDLVQKAGGFPPTNRWRAMFTKMPDYKLDYVGEFWNAGEFDRFLPQVIEGYQPSVSSSPSALPQS